MRRLLLPKITRTHLLQPPEEARKIAHVGKTQQIGNLGDRHGRVDQIALRLEQNATVYMLERRASQRPAADMVEICAAVMASSAAYWATDQCSRKCCSTSREKDAVCCCPRSGRHSASRCSCCCRSTQLPSAPTSECSTKSRPGATLPYSQATARITGRCRACRHRPHGSLPATKQGRHRPGCPAASRTAAAPV